MYEGTRVQGLGLLVGVKSGTLTSEWPKQGPGPEKSGYQMHR